MAVPVAILDDYQGVAERFGPWERLGDAIETTVFTDHLADDDALVERLAPFAVVVAMRERTPFLRNRLEIDRRVAHPGGDEQPQVRQPLEAVAEERRSLPHGHDDREGSQPVSYTHLTLPTILLV